MKENELQVLNSDIKEVMLNESSNKEKPASHLEF